VTLIETLWLFLVQISRPIELESRPEKDGFPVKADFSGCLLCPRYGHLSYDIAKGRFLLIAAIGATAFSAIFMALYVLIYAQARSMAG
jgi:hypothetical protein